MSKTTPEEAIALTAKHNVWLWMADDERFKRLASLIDEVRGVDAEPLGEVWVGSAHRDGFAIYWKEGHQFTDGIHKLYTHPAPSQPAAPVELPVVAWFYECADGTTLARTKDDKPVDDGEPLVKLSDAQAAIAAGRKAS